MKPIDHLEFERLESLSARKKIGLFSYIRMPLRDLKWCFEPRNDLNRLNARLRRDAGIDEHELERARLARAPLIR